MAGGMHSRGRVWQGWGHCSRGHAWLGGVHGGGVHSRGCGDVGGVGGV